MTTAFGLAILSTATLAFTACQSRTPSSAQLTAADEAEVRALFDSTVTRVSAGRWADWAGEFTDSAVMQPANQKALHGRPAVLAYGQAFPPLEHFSMWDVQVRGDGNLAYGTSAIGMKMKGAPADTAKQLVVFQRNPAGKWEVVAVSVNSDRPLAPPPPTPAAPKK